MAEITVNGLQVVSARIAFPLFGLWTASLVIDSLTALAGRADIAWGDQRFIGTVFRGGLFHGANRIVVIGGGGGHLRELDARSYRDVPASRVVADILAECGEPQSGAVPAVQLEHWTRTAGPATLALKTIADAIGANWRALDDGTSWVGAESWPMVIAPHQIMDHDLVSRWIEADFSQPTLRPGATWEGRRVHRVEYVIQSDSTRAWVLYE